MNTLSVSEWTLEAASTTEAIDRVAAAGYPAIEIAAVPELDVQAARERVDACGLTVSSMCWIGLGYPDRDCAHESERVRRQAGDYLRLCLDQAHALNADTLVLVPTFRTEPDRTGRDAELDRAARTITGAIEGMSADGVVIALEALNRYETHLLRTLADADELRRLIDSPNVQLMADVFHMNIEEDSIAASLRAYGENIVHVHLADSQRREPGSGHLDFGAVFEALADNAYTRTLAMEFVPATDAAIRAGREWVQARL
ncbi:MAG TPA: sugar phosphate isomerase/epimerase family protein [Solirubrobacteraceae bacterium]|nr:sugar phosphate isomerase/epimerase family protein [Solirubrobacteraceae bacterium]